MALSDPEKIDFIGISPDGFCVLTVADDVDWHDSPAHIEQLKAKLNTYVEFIQSGEIAQAYPDGRDSEPKIVVALRNAPPPVAVEFFKQAQTMITARGIEFSWQVFHAG